MAETALDDLQERLRRFRDARDWGQFHSQRALITSLVLEAAELLELTQWKSDEACEAFFASNDGAARLREECADVFLYLLQLADRSGIDLVAAAHEKIDANDRRYPVDLAKGSAAKHGDWKR